MKNHIAKTAGQGVQPAAPGMLRRKCSCGNGGAGASGSCDECNEKKLRRRSAGTAPAPAIAPPIVHDVLASSGSPLDRSTRSFMESRLGHDFSRVRVHAGGRAAESARAVGADAYAVGQSVVFGAGMYRPGSDAGRRLLAHELAHVAQSGAGPSPAGTIPIGSPDDPGEREADRAADAVMRGGDDAGRVRGGSASIPVLARSATPMLRRIITQTGEGSREIEPRDSGTTRRDGGAPPRDGGTTPRDGGPPSDAGPPATPTPAACTPGTSVRLVSTHTLGFPDHKTGGGLCAVMEVSPAVSGLCTVTEEVTADAGSTCPATLVMGGICAGSSTFTPGRNQVRACASVAMPASGFVDRHTIQVRGVSVLHDPARNPAGLTRCSATCNQRYFVTGNPSVTIGRFVIRYDLAQAVVGGENVTTVAATKTAAP